MNTVNVINIVNITNNILKGTKNQLQLKNIKN